MNKGLIVFGYPGVGKSSIAGWNNCIDLESSNFSRRDDEDWEIHYFVIASALAEQGYTVLMSTHQKVIDVCKKGLSVYKINVPAVIFCPKQEMRDQWAARLFNRYLRDSCAKNLRALDGAIICWDDKICALHDSGFKVYSPDSLDYDLRDYILKIREECCEGENG